MLPGLFACLALAFAQATEPISDTPFDRVIELQITAADEPAIEGHGPTVLAEYEVEFDGALHVWTNSKLDLFLRVDDASKARPLASDDDSGGGTTPYLELDVGKGDWLMVLIAGDPGATGPLTLHLVASPDTEAGRMAEAAAQQALSESARLVREGLLAQAREVTARALAEVMDTTGPGHPGLLSARSNLGISMYEMGDLAGARALGESVLAGYERSLPADHPNLLAARTNLASPMGDMGDLADARALRESVLAAYERSQPEDHPDLLRARANLAVSMNRMGDLSGARALRESVLAGYERSLPEGHPDLLRARANLAVSMNRMGDLAGARALEESVLARYERGLPDDHPDLLRARMNLAISMEEMGDLPGARALKESVLAGYEGILPEDHPDLLRARANLAVSMKAMGDLAGARALEESVLASRERILPEDHPALLLARANLAVTMEKMGDLAWARALEESVLAGYGRILPEGHPDLLRARANLAVSMDKTGDLAGGRALHESVVAAYERILPEDHPTLLRARANLAVSMKTMGDLARARTLEESILAGYGRILLQGHPDLLLARSNLAISTADTGDLLGARAMLPKLVAGMRMRILASLALAPRQARRAVASESHRHSGVLFFSESTGAELEGRVFELTETMRLVAAEAARSLARFETDSELAPILEEAAEVRRALNDLIAGTAREEAGAEGIAAEMTKLSLRRDRLERDASRRLAQRGVVTRPVEAVRLSEALGSDDLAIGYRRVAHWGVNAESGTTEIGADHLMVHVLDADGALARIDLGPAAELEELADAWRAELGAPLLRGISMESSVENPEETAGELLRARILDPVLDAAGEDVNRIFVCADDLLFLVPLDALPDGGGDAGTDTGDAARIGDRLRIVNEVSFARLLAPTGPVNGAPSLLAFGGVDYDAEGAAPEGLSGSSAPIEARDDSSGPSEAGPYRLDEAPDENDPASARASRSAVPERFQKLLQARYEAEATAGLFEEAFEIEPSLLTRGSTTKSALFESAPGKRYLHLATHGWFAPESVRSTEDARPEGQGFARMGIEDRVSGLAPMTLCGLALAGANRGRDSLGRVPGILTAEELCSLDLSQCELAVLSACETNVGIRRAGQGIQSLQSALYAAGARTSITSLWKVDDAATRRLMEVFYTNLWIDNLPKAEALWQAKQALRDEGHPPAHWAGWVLTGDPE